jgi:hypothetical protein
VFGVDGRLQLHNRAFQTLWKFTDADLADKPAVDAVRRLCRSRLRTASVTSRRTGP